MKSNTDKQKLLAELEKTPIVQFACSKAGISRATYYRWRDEDEVFKISANKALQESRVITNDLAEAQLITQIRESKSWAITYWLNHNHPIYIPPHHQLNIAEPIQKLNPEQEQLLTQVLQLVAASTSSVLQEKNNYFKQTIL